MSERKEPKTGDVTPAKSGHKSALRWPFEEIERMYEELLPRGWFPIDSKRLLFPHRLPAVDILDRDGEVIVRAEVPGVRKEDLNVTVSDDTLTIKGHTEHEEEEKREDYYRHELTYGDFTRALALPADVDTSKVNATMKDGILEIRFPKTKSTKPREVKVEVH